MEQSTADITYAVDDERINSIPTPVENGNKNWKSYTNNEYGFSFNYPNSINIMPGGLSDQDNCDGVSKAPLLPNCVKTKNLLDIILNNQPNQNLFTFTVSEKPLDKTVQQIAQYNRDFDQNVYQVGSVVMKTTGGKTGFQYLREGEGSVQLLYLPFGKDESKFLKITWQGDIQSSDLENLNQILSTFKFTN